MSSGATGHSSGASRRTQKSAAILDQYSTRRLDHGAVYPETWPLPTEEEFKAKYTKYDIGKILRTRSIGKFSGKANDYARFKVSFFANIHVQREPAHMKAGALDSLMDPEVREEIFGIGLGNSEFDYAERLERLERRFGGEERMVDLSLNKIKSLHYQSRKDYAKLRELVDAIHFYIRGVGRRDANSYSLREHLREGMPPSLLRRYMEETEEKGLEDTLGRLLEWTHRNVSLYFKHKEFEELWEKKPKTPKEKKGSNKPKPKEESGFAFMADSESSDSPKEETIEDARYQTQEACPKCQGPHPLYKCEEFYDQLPFGRRLFCRIEKTLPVVLFGRPRGPTLQDDQLQM